jgi:hypothetical protein
LVFVVGIVVTAMSIVRITYARGFTGINATYHLSYWALYSNIEAYLSQIYCTMPGMASLVGRTWKTASSDLGSLGSDPHVDSIRISGPIMTTDRHDFGDLSTSYERDLEKSESDDKWKTSSSVEDEEDGDDAAPPPVVQRASHQSHSLRHQPSFEPIIETLEQHRATLRSSATTAVQAFGGSQRASTTLNSQRASTTFDSSHHAPTTLNSHHASTTFDNSHRASTTDHRTPDILYHDRQNHIRLEIHDPPEQPVTAQLQYVDKHNGVHDLELQGRVRPHTAPTPAPAALYSTTNYDSDSTSSSTSVDSSAATSPDPQPASASASASAPASASARLDGPRFSHLKPDLLPWAAAAPKKRPSLAETARGRSEEEQLMDLANAHKLLTEGGMMGPPPGRSPSLC